MLALYVEKSKQYLLQQLNAQLTKLGKTSANLKSIDLLRIETDANGKNVLHYIPAKLYDLEIVVDDDKTLKDYYWEEVTDIDFCIFDSVLLDEVFLKDYKNGLYNGVEYKAFMTKQDDKYIIKIVNSVGEVVENIKYDFSIEDGKIKEFVSAESINLDLKIKDVIPENLLEDSRYRIDVRTTGHVYVYNQENVVIYSSYVGCEHIETEYISSAGNFYLKDFATYLDDRIVLYTKYNQEKYDKGYTIVSSTVDLIPFSLDDNGDVNVLLIKRGAFPYEGCYATIGGFVNPGENPAVAVKREADEETRLGKYLPDDFELFKSSSGGKDGSATNRDLRGTYTEVYATYFDTPPEVEAGDDAKLAKWFPIEYEVDDNFRGYISIQTDNLVINYQFESEKNGDVFSTRIISGYGLAFDHAVHLISSLCLNIEKEKIPRNSKKNINIIA